MLLNHRLISVEALTNTKLMSPFCWFFDLVPACACRDWSKNRSWTPSIFHSMER
jgi:hypothetical protein